HLGATAHQILLTPSGAGAVLPVRGTDAGGGGPEDPGSLEVLASRDGQLAPRHSIAPDGGLCFGPRHVDFHPSKPRRYRSVQRRAPPAQFVLGPSRVEGPFNRASTLLRPESEKPRQLAGAIHIHPSGRFAYVSNRADGTVDHDGRKVFNGG